MIAARGVHRSFGATVALAGADLPARQGRIVGLLGPNGAGKSTLLRIVTGLLRADQGTVEVDGVDVVADPLAARARLGVLADARGLHPRLTAAEHLRYSGRLHGLDDATVERRIETLGVRLDLGRLLHRRVAGFSQGERMKVALGRALVHDPPNLLLDEPQNGLDVDAVRALRGLLRAFAAEGRAVVLSSHQMAEVAEVADDVVILARGRTAFSGTLEELRAHHDGASLEDAFVATVRGAVAEGPP
ncbi:MAG: ATP-binding cassette domain-containing protein [Deltaproteobacteria bacterium]|nr:ATP-binding cassette domain-containing protein [Deltaproteobacteria bacterium]